MWIHLNTGQIKLYQPLGQWIASVASNTLFTRFLEVGSWNGRGSTICFAAGFEKRNTPCLLKSFEINVERANESKAVWNGRMSSIEIIHGRILSTLPDVKSIHSNIVESWQADDERSFLDSPFIDVSDFKPEVVLLDGGEYITYFEYKLLEPTTHVFLLDDANAEKCRRVCEELTANPKWKLVDRGDDRNGWAVFQRVAL
jgi:hypothetical protein